MKAAEVGSRFVRFFEQKGHTVVPSAPLMYNDPTLLFVNAGMVPFKPYLIGAETAPYDRAVSVQKCVRTLDIDEVGKTTRHGTFFQMNGNFSFGDYFKKEAIEFAWELVTTDQDHGGYGFDPSSIWVTVLGPGYHPDYPDGDVEAREFWRGVGVPDDHIQGRTLKDNYWSMGVPGPGGPCSEIYVDRGAQYGPDGGPEADEDRFLEIWNLVFETENLSAVRAKDDFDIAGPLPAQNIDTGMGLERVAYLLQGKDNLYEIDQVFPVIERASQLCGRAYGASHDDDVRLRVVADHVRSGLMLMSDGVTPGNEARGYVLRRLLRRSIRSMRIMGVSDPVLVDLLGVSRDCMVTSYPEIAGQWERLSQAAAAEEESFDRTLRDGTAIFDMAVGQTKQAGQTILSGDKAFQLHDTYGFPIDLTLEMAAEQGLQVDRDRFTELMTEQRNRARADARAKKTGTVAVEAYRTLRDAGETPFLGYTDLVVPTTVCGLVVNGESVLRAEPGATVEVVLAQTPFYAESGGQDADAGVLVGESGRFDVLDVQRPVPGLIVHKVLLEDAPLEVGERVSAEVDARHRRASCQAHSATHLLHAALRELVGPTATQAGSYNRPGYLRFDYTGQQAMSDELRAEIEERCNIAIADSLGVSATTMKLEDAKAMGAMSLFGEKYPPIVRMVEMGGAWSRELCGGTHVPNTAQVGMFTLLSEQSVGSGARRIEALVSTDAFQHLAAERALVNQLAGMLRVPSDQVVDRVSGLIGDLKTAEKQLEQARAEQVLAGADRMLAKAKDIRGVALVAQSVPGASGDQLRTLAGRLRDGLGARAGVVALVGGPQDKPVIVVCTNQPARDKGAKAGALVRLGAAPLGGKGGGKDDFAQGGGADGTAAPRALQAIQDALAHAGA
ncbi:MAG: alanine--tRNA ligase [Propionibacteriaceae bacterium]|nr:alanine--tRNA ligase [Propionibacteriaceae bacterium]